MAVRKIIRNKKETLKPKGRKNKIILWLFSIGLFVTLFALTTKAAIIGQVVSSVSVPKAVSPIVTGIQNLPIVTSIPTVIPTKVLQIVPTIVVTTDPIPTSPIQVTSAPPVVTVDNSKPINNVPSIPTGIISTPVAASPTTTVVPTSTNIVPSTWTNTPVPTQVGGVGNVGGNTTNTNETSNTSSSETSQKGAQQIWNISPSDSSTTIQNKESTLFYTKESFRGEQIPVREVTQKENSFLIDTEANTRVFLISTTNSCHGFSSMTFTTNKKISGSIFIDEDPNLKLSQYSSANIYSACKLSLQGFSYEDIQDVQLKARYTNDWAEKNTIQPSDLKIFSSIEPNNDLNQKFDVKVIGDLQIGEETYNIVEADLNKLPKAFGLAQLVQEDVVAKEIPVAAGIVGSSKWKPFLGSVVILVALGFTLAVLHRIMIKRRYNEISDTMEKPVFW